MILKPTKQDYNIILFYTGKILVGLGIVEIIPLIVSLFTSEWSPMTDFLFGAGITFSIGYFLQIRFNTDEDLQWNHGMCTAAFSWLMCTFLGAIPHYLSGHFGSYLDACFDVMSGYTTTGLILIQNLDHISYGLNIWRHLLTFIGGQGMITIVIMVTIKGFSGAYKMYVGEGKDEKLMPNVIRTTRAIWAISMTYCAVGTSVLWLIGMKDGLNFWSALFHGFCMFCSTWSTGGFAPMSQNLMYYHSPLFEFVCGVIMVVGSLNFAVHFMVWSGKWREIYKDIEVRSFAITSFIAFLITAGGLISVRAYPNIISVYRFAANLVFSAHTTTGTMNVFARQLITHWGQIAVIGLIIAMAIGGSAASTAGGFKGLRMGIIFKGLMQDIKKLVSPEGSVVVQRFHHGGDVVLEDSHLRSAAGIVLMYIMIYAIGTLIGMLYGYPLLDAMFDSVSAGSNSGLSVGVTAFTMPTLMKVVYFIEMFLGRLEFNAVLVLGGFICSSFLGKGGRKNGKKSSC